MTEPNKFFNTIVADNNVGIYQGPGARPFEFHGGSIERNGIGVLDAGAGNLLSSLGLPPDAPIRDLVAALNQLQQAHPLMPQDRRNLFSASRFGTWLGNLSNGSTVVTNVMQYYSTGKLDWLKAELERFLK